MTKHGKVYATEEEHHNRFEIWKQNRDIINTNNAAIKSGEITGAWFGYNKFSDLTPEEFRNTYLMKNYQTLPKHQRRYVTLKEGVNVPKSFDWRTLSKVTAVKDQGQCGSCWAFSATENIESVWMIAKDLKNDTMKPLSPQQIVDCDKKDAGCNGGDTPTAYHYVIKAGGLDTEADYPYRAKDEKCSFKKDSVFAHIKNWKYVTEHHDEKKLREHIATISPASICVDAAKWQNYESGVMTAEQCAKHVVLDHCVQLVGYNLDDSHPYWIVRNSWSRGWGEDGYIRLAYGHNTCGLTNEATTAEVK